MPAVYKTIYDVRFIKSAHKVFEYKNIEEIIDWDEGVEQLKKYVYRNIEEFDIIHLGQTLNQILVKNSRGILCRIQIHCKNSIFKKTVEHKFECILPIQAIKLLKIFNVKEKKDLQYLYPYINITAIIDNNKNIYQFYSPELVTKYIIKITDGQMEHEIYVSSSINLATY